MSSFHFRLATLLKLRDSDRNARREQLSQAQEAERIIEEQQQQLNESLNNVKAANLKAVEPGRVDVDALMHSNRSERMLQAQQATLRGQKKMIDEAVQQRRELLMEADRAVKVLEKLREKQEAQFQQTQHRSEVRQMDEIAQRVRTLEHDAE